jgi:hypothetical protein
MKTKVSHKTKQLGNALLVAMCISAFLCISITGYLTVTEQQNFLSARSQAWNMAIAITESGVEEGLEQLNSNATNLTADGWSYDGSCYSRSNNMGAGNSYIVTIYTTNAFNPVIIARAFTTPPTLAQNSSSPSFFAAVGVNTTAGPVTRAVKVTCSKGNIFACALVAKNSIDLKGNGVYTDSFNSQDPSKSTGGKYNSSQYSGDRGDIACNGGINDSVGVQNANIYGKVHTGPGCAVSIGAQGGVGPHGSQTSSIATATANGYVLQDANFTFPDTTYPNTSSYLSLPPGGTVVSTSYTYNTNAVNGSSTYPNPPPPWGGVVTNNNPSTVSTYPNPVPPGLTTNTAPVTSSSLPSPIVAGTVTNAVTTPTGPTLSYPAAGTYVGGVTTNIVSNGPPSGRGTWYTYNLITGHTYTYNAITYTYPVYTYNYNTFITNSILVTNVYDAILTANNSYVASSLSGKKVLVNGANITLALANGMDGTENLTWAAGANLLVYSGGTSITVSGNGYINPNGAAASLIIYAAPTVTSFTLNGNGQFTGVLVAPSADVSMHGGGSSNEDFCGSLMCNSVGLNGHFSFHYDESLSTAGGNNRFLISSWNEIP